MPRARAEIADVALNLFIERGFDAVTVVASGDLRSRASAILVVASFRAALVQWVRSSADDDLHRLVDDAFNLLEDGLLAAPAAHEVRDG